MYEQQSGTEEFGRNISLANLRGLNANQLLEELELESDPYRALSVAHYIFKLAGFTLEDTTEPIQDISHNLLREAGQLAHIAVELTAWTEEVKLDVHGVWNNRLDAISRPAQDVPAA